MAAKLTKTQQYLIDRAKKYDGAAVDVVSGRGAFGGRISAGNRERTALHKLRDMGLVEIVNQMTSNDYNRGYCVWFTTIHYRLSLKGAA